MTYHVLRNGETLGPWPEEQIRQMLAAGQITGDDLAWREGLAEWVPLSSLIAVTPPTPAFPALPVVPPAPVTAPQPAVRFAGQRNYSPMGIGTKVLIGVGALGAVLVFGFMGLVFTHLFKMQSSAGVYVTDYVGHLAPAWSSDELMSRLTPEYRGRFDEKEMRVMFKKLALLGDLKKADAPVAYAKTNSFNGHRQTVANVDEHATFDNGEATFHVYLVQIDGKWTIAGFHVQSPVFDKAK